MGQVHGSPKASKFAPDDVISSMHEDVIISILNRLPLQDAVRTGILSKSCKHFWTMITQLVFDEDFYKYLQGKEKEKDYGTIINMFLNHLKGDITKFYLYIEEGCNSILDDEDIGKWVLFLSGKGIEEFTQKNMDEAPLELSNIFSCIRLNYLELYNCYFHSMAGFRGFPNLLSLDLSEVGFGSDTCGEFVTRCPSMESMKLRDNIPSEIKLAQIAKLEKLKVSDLPLRELGNNGLIKSSIIFHLMGYFPKIQELNLDFWDCKVRLLTDAEMTLPTTLPCLKTLRLYEINFSNGTMVSCAIDLICGSPNLETLLIKSGNEDDVPVSDVSSSEADFSKLGQLQLRKVEFAAISCKKNEVRLMELLLGCSPLLEKMVFSPKSSKVFTRDGENEFVTKLTQHRASQVAEIVIQSANIAMTSHNYPHV